MKYKSSFLILLLTITCVGGLWLFQSIFANEVATDENVFEVNTAYSNAVVNSEGWHISVSYDTGGNAFEIAKDIVISTDRQQNDILPLTGCVAEENEYVYSFEGENGLDQIFVSDPVIYIASDVTKWSIPVFSVEETSVFSVDQQSSTMFEISNVVIEEAVDGTFPVVVSVVPIDGTVPRFPELELGNTTYKGVTVHEFDEDGNYLNGSFIFYIEGDSSSEIHELLEGAMLSVDKVLVKATATAELYSLGMTAIDVVYEGER